MINPQRLQRREHSPWWQTRRDALRAIAARHTPCYVYDPYAIRDQAAAVRRTFSTVTRIFYAVKANNNFDVLRLLYACGLGFECVSPGELHRLLRLFPGISPERIVFTPNFAPRQEYELALERGVWLTLDSLYILQNWGAIFAGHDVLLRVDLGQGEGHHAHVRTAGAASKFGIPVRDLPAARRFARTCGIRIVGLHTHAGSGIHDPGHWPRIGLALAELAADFPDLRILNLGGGFGVREHPADSELDLALVNERLRPLHAARPDIELWLEPGRLLVAEAGVLLTRVTQLKEKSSIRYAGVDTGMNSLLRPALYGAYHPIVNLDRHESPAVERYTVVGPICETGDVMGTARHLPETREGDVLLIANAGAYGHVMSSHYNLRPPAPEIMLKI